MGTSSKRGGGKSPLKDHPHAYGDKMGLQNQTENYQGSSPRVWGQEKDVTWGMAKSRIIPTRMGTSKGCFGFCVVRGDHPHAYGDKTKEIKENSGFAKSTA